MRQSVFADAGGVGPKPPRRNDRRPEEGVDVHDRGEGPVDARCPRFLRHDPGDGARGLHIIDRRKRKGVRHLGPEGQAHPAAFQIGADQVWDRRFGTHGVQRVKFRARVGAEEFGDPCGGKGGDTVNRLWPGAKADVDEKLADPGCAVHAGEGGPHPTPPFAIKVEGRGGKDAVNLVHHGRLLPVKRNPVPGLTRDLPMSRAARVGNEAPGQARGARGFLASVLDEAVPEVLQPFLTAGLGLRLDLFGDDAGGCGFKATLQH